MGIIDQFRKGKNEAKEHTTPPPEGQTLAEILKDKKRSHIFGKQLEKDGQKDLARRLAEGKLEEDDIGLLETQRLAFLEKITRAEQVRESLTVEGLVEIAHNNPDFEKILNLVGPEKALKVIEGQLEEISVTDEYRFNGITRAVTKLENYRTGKYKEVNDKIEKMCKDGQFTPKEYLDALAIDDPKEKDKALRQLVQKSMGRFKKLVSSVARRGTIASQWAYRGLEDLKDAGVSLEWTAEDLEIHQKDLGFQLFFSIADNPAMRNALSKELIGEKIEAEQKSGFEEAKKEGGAFDEEKCDADWETYKQQEAYHVAISDSERNTIKDNFIKMQKKKHEEKTGAKGFWHSIFSTLFEKKIDDKRKTLK